MVAYGRKGSSVQKDENALLTIFAGLGLIIGWWRYRRALIRRRAAELLASLPDVTDLLLAALFAGCTPSQALRFLAHAAPLNVRGAFIDVVAALDRGDRLSSTLRQLPSRLGSEYRPLCDIIGAGDRLGIPTETLIAQVSSDAHLTRRLLADAEARRLPVRLSLPLVCCTLPSFVVLVIVPVIAGTLSHLHIIQ